MAISINYDVLNEEGNHILDTLNDYENYIDNTNKIIKDLNLSWKSDNYLLFKDKYDNLTSKKWRT